MIPTIGMVADVTMRKNSFADYITDDVSEAIKKAGGLPIIFPTSDSKYAEDFLSKCDGMAFLGGPDVDPTLYDEEPIPELGYTYRQKDELELELVRQAYAAGKAIFGICRGIQVINVGLGGTVYQDFPSQSDRKVLKHFQAAPLSVTSHHVNVMAGSHLEKIMGDYPMVNSHHHEAVKDLGNDLKVTARAADDCVEAIESMNSDQLLAAQWHPECLYTKYPEHDALFTDFVNRVKKRMQDVDAV